MDDPGVDVEDAVSPRRKTSLAQPIPSFGAMNNPLDALDIRADPDAQATVTDFLDFTEYLPADIMRSLTLIGQLDRTYIDASTNVHDLTTTWGRLPEIPPDERPAPVQLRAKISENLNQAVSSRSYSHAEAVRMADNVARHYNRAKIILGKLQTMMDNYPTAEEQKSPVAPKSPQMSRTTKVAVRNDGGPKVRRQRVPRVTIPGEVLAPYELEYDTFSDDESDASSDREEGSPPPRATPAAQPRIKLVKTPKTPKIRTPRPTMTGLGNHPLSTSGVLAQLKPPPEDAKPGDDDAPWLQLTPYELAKLRKRMKKNAQWTPSETMIARELKILGRGVEAWREAKKLAEAENRPFDNRLPSAVVDENGVPQPPLGALSIDAAIAAEDKQNTNRGMKLNAAKKIKRESLAQLAARDAEESARKMANLAAAMFVGNPPPQEPATGKTPSNARQRKRKRNSEAEVDAEKPENSESPSQRPQVKRPKTETPVPIPHPAPPSVSSVTAAQEGSAQAGQLTTGSGPGRLQSTTPVPVPIPPQDQAKASSSQSPASTDGAQGSNTVTTTTIPTKAPVDGLIPPPAHDTRKSTTPILPPARETRTREAARKEQAKEIQLPARPSSRQATPAALESSRRPLSRGGKAASQEPPSLAMDRPRRASTARNTPVPEARQPGKRPKRPAPGVISRTNSGGNSAVGKRKAAPKKKRGASRKDKGQADGDIEVEVDDEGNVIDPNEERYCLCNGVSFGTMIQCDNPDSCKQEWFHLECVGLTDIPARTTKWYCPDCRVLLKIGERGEVSARGVRA